MRSSSPQQDLWLDLDRVLDEVALEFGAHTQRALYAVFAEGFGIRESARRFRVGDHTICDALKYIRARLEEEGYAH